MTYTIAFRFKGGHLPAHLVGERLGIAPRYMKVAGEEIIDRAGSVIGQHPKHSGSFPVTEYEEAGALCSALGIFMDRLEAAAGLLEEMRAAGATFDFYTVIFCKAQEGETFDASIMERMGRLGIALHVTFVPEALRNSGW